VSDWRLAQAAPDFLGWLANGAPSDDATETWNLPRSKLIQMT
jgi:hypothetical protein